MKNNPYNLRYVVSVSSGASSAVAAINVLNRINNDNVDLVFCDTMVEDEDNYRFLNDLEKITKPIKRLSLNKTPQQIWEDSKIIPNSLIAPCTKTLKLDLIVDYVKQLQNDGYNVAMCIGFSKKDLKRNPNHKIEFPKYLKLLYPGRLLNSVYNWSKMGCLVEFPCLWNDKPVEQTLNECGLKLPRMYEMGFSSANCKGKCPKGGIKHWITTLEQFPESFEEIMLWEKKMRTNDKFKNHSILRKTVEGSKITYPLEQLKEDYIQKKKSLLIDAMYNEMESTCSNSECGVE